MPKVYNIYHKDAPEGTIDCSRRGIYDGELGNPFTHSRGPTLAEFQVATREEAVQRHDVYMRARIATDQNYANMIESLRGLDLMCYCAPRSCHCWNYIRYLEETDPNAQARSRRSDRDGPDVEDRQGSGQDNQGSGE